MFCALEKAQDFEDDLNIKSVEDPDVAREELKAADNGAISDENDDAKLNNENASSSIAPKKKAIVWTEETIEAAKKALFEKVTAKVELVKESYETKNYVDMKYRNAFHYLSNCYFGLKNAPLEERVKMRLEIVDIFIAQKMIPALIGIFSELMEQGLPTEFVNLEGEVLSHILRPSRTTLAVAFNFSDVSYILCQELMKTNLTDVVFKVLSELRTSHFNKTLHVDVGKLLRQCIAVIYNIVMHDEVDYVDEMHDAGLVAAVQPYLNSPNEFVRASSLFFTIYVVDEEEASKFCTNESALKFVIKNLKVAVKDKYKRGRGYSNQELLKVLAKLSALDIKEKLAKVGTLDLMKSLLETGDQDEVEWTVKILWQLSFDERNALWIKDSNIQELLEGHVDKSTSKDFVRAVQGLTWVVEEKTGDNSQLHRPKSALWKSKSKEMRKSRKMDSKIPSQMVVPAPPPPPPGFGGSEPPPPKPCGGSVPPPPPLPAPVFEGSASQPAPPSSSTSKFSVLRSSSMEPAPPRPSEECVQTSMTTQSSVSDQHIMISYDWGMQKSVVSIKNFLSDHGQRVWLDLDDMGDNTLDGMAYAVENAWLVLICVTRKYKESQNCRLEAEYAFRLRKAVIPLMMDRYRPDGWLGFLIGAKLYYDFSGKYPFDVKCEELLKAMNKMIGGEISLDKTDSVDAPVIVKETETIPEAVKPDSSVPTVKRDLKYLDDWNTERVTKWCRENNIEWSGMLSITGSELRFLARVHSESPDFFYRCLETKLQLRTLREMAQFVDAMDKL